MAFGFVVSEKFLDAAEEQNLEEEDKARLELNYSLVESNILPQHRLIFRRSVLNLLMENYLWNAFGEI